MKFLVFTFYIFSVLPSSIVQGMDEKIEKEVTFFQPKSLQKICLKSFYSSNNLDQELFSTENINLLNKNFSLALYPIIAYHIIKTHKITNISQKCALITFLRDYPDTHAKKTQKILHFFTQFIDTKNYFSSTLLAVAISHSIKPSIVNFLLQNGEQPNSSLVWFLIGNEKFRPEIHSYAIKKLAYLLTFNTPLDRKPSNNFITPSGLKPLEYAQAMLTCWQDEAWTKGYKEKQFNEHFRPKLCEAQSQETIDNYKKFFSEVIDLLITHESKIQ